MPEENKSPEPQQEPQKEKESSNKNEELLNSISEELKKVSIVVTDGLYKMEKQGESSNTELKNVTSSITEIKETVNNISLTTDSQSDAQQQQIESLNSLLEETKQSKTEIKGAIDKQTKEQSKISKKEMKLMAASNTELKTQNKGFKKLSKAIENFEGGGGGGGGGLFGMLFSLAGLVMTVLGTVVSSIGSVFPGLITAIAAAGGSALIYKYLIEPAFDEREKKNKAIVEKPTINREQVEAGGQKQFVKEDEKGNLQVYSESEMNAELSKIKDTTQRATEQTKFKGINTVTADSGEAGTIDIEANRASTGHTVMGLAEGGAKSGFNLTLEEKEQFTSAKTTKEKTAVLQQAAERQKKQQEEPKTPDELKANTISALLQNALIIRGSLKKKLSEISKLAADAAMDGGTSKLAEMFGKYDPAKQLYELNKEDIKRLQISYNDALKKGILTPEEYDALGNASFLFRENLGNIKERMTGIAEAGKNAITDLGLFTFGGTTEKAVQGILDAAYNRMDAGELSGIYKVGPADLPMLFKKLAENKNSAQNATTSQTVNKAVRSGGTAILQDIGAATNPMLMPQAMLSSWIAAQNTTEAAGNLVDRAKDKITGHYTGGIVTGSQRGFQATLHGTEAIINPKSPQGDQVTGAIAKNLVKEMSDVKSLQKESIMIQDGLSRSKNEHYDMTVAQPLSSGGGNTNNIVNNMMSAGGDSRQEPNSQFSPGMLMLTHNELVTQQVLSEIKRAELL